MMMIVICWIPLCDVPRYPVYQLLGEVRKVYRLIKFVARIKQHTHIFSVKAAWLFVPNPLIKPSLEFLDVNMSIVAHLDYLPDVRNRNPVHLNGHLVMNNAEHKLQAIDCSILDRTCRDTRKVASIRPGTVSPEPPTKVSPPKVR